METHQDMGSQMSDGYHYFGMHAGWWAFLAVMVIAVVMFRWFRKKN